LIPPPIYEFQWTFSGISDHQFMVSLCLGVVNLVECTILWAIASEPSIPFVQLIHSLLWIMIPFAVLYFAVPLLRYFVIMLLNKSIDARNEERKNKVPELLKGLEQMKEKRNFLQQNRMDVRIREQDIVFESQSAFPELELKAYEDIQIASQI